MECPHTFFVNRYSEKSFPWFLETSFWKFAPSILLHTSELSPDFIFCKHVVQEYVVMVFRFWQMLYLLLQKDVLIDC